MVPEKTKLLCYTPKGFEQLTLFWEHTSPILMSKSPVPFSSQAEHVGLLRSTTPGEMAAISARIAAHTKALYAVLPAGLARRHHGNPAASLRVHQLYGIPVLLSGLSTLVLNNQELDVLDHHHKTTLERLLKLYPRTPAPVVYFLAGSPPARALLHSRQLSLLGMVARLGSKCPLFRYAVFILNNPPPQVRIAAKIWFLQVRTLCAQYGLPDPLEVLKSPPSKQTWKTAVTRSVHLFWRSKLILAADALPSLAPLRFSHMSLVRPSPLLTSCHNKQYEVKKATVQLKMASGRYRTCWLRRHWSSDSSGHCRVPGCAPDTPGTLVHLATGQCQGLSDATAAASASWARFAAANPHLLPLLTTMASSAPDVFLSFLLDPSTNHLSLALSQQLGNHIIDQLCYLTRTWLYTLHVARYRALGLWQYL